MTVQELFSLLEQVCKQMSQDRKGCEVFHRPSPSSDEQHKVFIEKLITERFFGYFNLKYPNLNCQSWLRPLAHPSDSELFWYPARNADALIPGDEQSALFLEFKVFDKTHDGHKGCDVRNAFVQLLQYMMKDQRPNKEGAVLVFDIWQDATKDRKFDARPHDKEFVRQFRKMSYTQNIHLIWIWFDKKSKKVLCDLYPRE